jgi:hypothetical protein
MQTFKKLPTTDPTTKNPIPRVTNIGHETNMVGRSSVG